MLCNYFDNKLRLTKKVVIANEVKESQILKALSLHEIASVVPSSQRRSTTFLVSPTIVGYQPGFCPISGFCVKALKGMGHR